MRNQVGRNKQTNTGLLYVWVGCWKYKFPLPRLFPYWRIGVWGMIGRVEKAGVCGVVPLPSWYFCSSLSLSLSLSFVLSLVPSSIPRLEWIMHGIVSPDLKSHHLPDRTHNVGLGVRCSSSLSLTLSFATTTLATVAPPLSPTSPSLAVSGSSLAISFGGSFARATRLYSSVASFHRACLPILAWLARGSTSCRTNFGGGGWKHTDESQSNPTLSLESAGQW
jgi:hypothetical protein